MRLVYDSLQKLRGGAPYPWRPGEVVKGTRTPSEKLNLQPGDLVRVRDYREILKTLDQDWRNRGMYISMASWCPSATAPTACCAASRRSSTRRRER